MHIGRRTIVTDADGEECVVTKASKTECVFFPAPGYFKRQAIGFDVSESDVRLLTEEGEKCSESKRTARTKLEDKLYDESSKTKEVQMVDGFITYCRHFKYLGSWITYNLRDDKDIDMRIAAASKAMSALNGFFSRKEIALESKYAVFMAIPINLLVM
ncbi:hypothetical protein ACHAWF_009889 [Thalassiosira exigua]